MTTHWNWTLALISVVTMTSLASAQSSTNRARSDQQERQSDTSRYDRDHDDRSNRDEYQQGSDRNRTADSNDTWSEWFSDLFTTNGSSSSSQNRGTRNVDTNVDKFIERYDDNDDGQLSKNELPSRLQNGYQNLDRNNDQKLSRSELRQHAQKQMQSQTPVAITYVWILDTDQGRVKLSELQKSYDLMQEIDQDNDGEISRSELDKRRQLIASRMVDDCFQQHDDNYDDKLSRNEISGTHLQSRFDSIDLNGDDHVTRTELRQEMNAGSKGSQGESSKESARYESSASRDSDEVDRR